MKPATRLGDVLRGRWPVAQTEPTKPPRLDTCVVYKAHIMSKLNAKNRTDLIRYALKRGLVGLEAPARSTMQEELANG